MAVFVHICDLMFLDDSSFHYEPYYEVGAVLVVLSLESCSLHRTPLLKRSLVYYSLYRCLFDSFIPGLREWLLSSREQGGLSALSCWVDGDAKPPVIVGARDIVSSSSQ